MWTGLADFIERVPTLIGKLSIPALVIGISLEIAMREGFIARTAWDGRVADTAPLLWVSGFALAVVWALLEIPKLPSKWKKVRDKRAHYQQIRDNLQFLNPDARLLLYFMVKYQGGRTPHLGSTQPFKDLKGFGVIEMEWEFIGAMTDATGTFRVSKALPHKRLLEEIEPSVQRAFQIDLSNRIAVEWALTSRLKAIQQAQTGGFLA